MGGGTVLLEVIPFNCRNIQTANRNKHFMTFYFQFDFQICRLMKMEKTADSPQQVRKERNPSTWVGLSAPPAPVPMSTSAGHPRC